MSVAIFSLESFF